MIIPQFWEEARVQEQVNGRPVTVRRWGWSDTGASSARAHAEERAREAIERIRTGAKQVNRREAKVPYNGADGMPIREEIVDRQGETIITRNSYGALCLNTPNVLFADIDVQDFAVAGDGLLIIALTIGGAVLGWLLLGSWVAIGGVVGGLIAGWVLGEMIAARLRARRRRAMGDPTEFAIARVADFVKAHPDWFLRLYKTPAGLRVLALHRTFDPSEPAVASFFDAVHADPVYVRMCLNQQCFRARVSPKPWRIKVGEHIKPRTAWPVAPERMPARREWVAQYERESLGYASCRFLQVMGRPSVHPVANRVLGLHDSLCRATTDLPLA